MNQMNHSSAGHFPTFKTGTREMNPVAPAQIQKGIKQFPSDNDNLLPALIYKFLIFFRPMFFILLYLTEGPKNVKTAQGLDKQERDKYETLFQHYC